MSQQAETTPSSQPVYSPVSTSENATNIEQLELAKLTSQLNDQLNDRRKNEEAQRLGRAIGMWLVIILLTLLCGWQIAMVYIGLVYRNDCNVDDICLWLIVFGSGGIISYIMRMIDTTVEFISKNENGSTCLRCLIWLMNFFLFIWFLIGNFWVYRNYNKVSYDKLVNPSNYCYWLCYRFAFWSVTVSWILFGIVCLFVLYLCIRKKSG